MAKPTKPTQSRAPTAKQLETIDGLIERARFDQAAAKLRPLLERCPAHSGVRRRCVDLSQASRGPKAGALAAFQWAEALPDCLEAQETLLAYAASQGHVLLADRTARRVQAVGGDTVGFPLAPDELERLLASAVGPNATAELMTCFDIGKLHLEANDFASAARWLEGLDLLPARNNLALALYHQGQIDEASAAYLSAWEADPQNLFALGWAIRLRLQRGDETGASGLCTPLAAARARRTEDAIGQLNGLLLMRQDQAAWEAFRQIGRASWFGSEPFGTAMLEHFGACAAARLGKEKDAPRLWRKALKRVAELDLAEANLEQLKRDPATLATPIVFDLAASLPLGVTERLRSDPEAALKQITAATPYLEALYASGDPTLRRLVTHVLGDRAIGEDWKAVAAIKRIAASPAGTTDERLKLISFLREAELLADDEPVQYWDGKSLTEVKMIATEIHREPSESDLPDALLELLGQSIQDFNAGRHARAETLLAKILKQVPRHPVALGNLAAVRMTQGRRDEGLQLLEQVVAANPDYLMARCNLAALAIEDGDFARAEELLSHLIDRPRLHIQEYFTVVGTMARLHAAKGDLDQAQRLIDGLEPMIETEDDEHRFDQIRRSVERYGIEREMANIFKLMSRPRARRPRKPKR